MKILKYVSILSVALLLFSCTKEQMDKVNEDKNSTSEMEAKNLIPDAILKSAYETTNTDMAWYASVYIEHSAGTWGQFAVADRREAQTSSSLLNNSWTSLYDVMNICKTIMDKTDPTTGTEKDNFFSRGVAEILMAYNLAVATDMWGEVPYTEAFKGLLNLKPAFEKQSVIYAKVQALLDAGIVDIGLATTANAAANAPKDYIYSGSKAKWIKAAYSLKARYYLRLEKRDATAAAKALTALANGFTSNADDMMFAIYDGDNVNNPWASLWYERTALSVSKTFEDILIDRNDPRFDYLILTKAKGPAPNGVAEEVQSGYDVSTLSTNYYGFANATPMITYKELKFIEAEAKFRTGDATWTTSLENAIAESFNFIENNYGGELGPFSWDAADYYTNEVLPLLTPGNELKEILTQKYISEFEYESLEAYNDYRRTGIPTLNNPRNTEAGKGFMNRFPFPYSEVSNNPNNVPTADVFTDKVWWAGGTDKI